MKLFFRSSIALMILLLVAVKSDGVCDENTLVTELKQDIADNNQLDCLRVPKDVNTEKHENDEQKKIRIAAMWDSDCSFEADYDWASLLKNIYGLEKGLVDVDGNAVKHDFEDQADMCELVRAMIAGGLVPSAKADVKYIEESATDGIDCPGDSGIKKKGGGAPKCTHVQLCAGEFGKQ